MSKASYSLTVAAVAFASISCALSAAAHDEPRWDWHGHDDRAERESIKLRR